MNRILLILLISLCTTIVAHGQRLLLRGGATMPWISYTDSENYPKAGFSLSIAKEYPLGNFYLQPEVGLIMKGCDFTYDRVDHKLSLYYFQMAAPLKYFFNNGKNRIYALAGPTLCVGMFGQYHYEDDFMQVEFVPYPNGGYDRKYYAYIDHRFEFTTILGAGVELGKLIIEVRYDHGLTKLYNHSDENRGDFDNKVISTAKNRLLQLTIGIPLKN